MYHFFIEPSWVAEETVCVYGEDVNHIRNVLRMKSGEAFMANDRNGKEYYCIITELEKDKVTARIAYCQESGQELPCEITLYQGLPKADKLELIIQKAVELGASRIVPVAMKRSVVKLDEKKAQVKGKRWQAIAESAAKQAGRGIVPTVGEMMSFSKALEEAKQMECRLFPYELAGTEADIGTSTENVKSSMTLTRERFSAIKAGERIAIFIGPEGGFDKEEVELAKSCGFEPITLGKRILRTETAGLYVLSVLGFLLEP